MTLSVAFTLVLDCHSQLMWRFTFQVLQSQNSKVLWSAACKRVFLSCVKFLQLLWVAWRPAACFWHPCTKAPIQVFAYIGSHWQLCGITVMKYKLLLLVLLFHTCDFCQEVALINDRYLKIGSFLYFAEFCWVLVCWVLCEPTYWHLVPHYSVNIYFFICLQKEEWVPIWVQATYCSQEFHDLPQGWE